MAVPWFRVDDTFTYHSKAVAAGNGACGLWVRAGAWSMQQLTDGFVPSHIARQLGTRTEIARLVTSGLWVEKDGGYLFHEWPERQPSRAKLQAEREANAERIRRWREANKRKGETDV